MAEEPRPNHIAHDLLSRAHSPNRTSAIFKDKVLHKPLNLRPTSPDPTSQDARAKRRLHRLRKKEHVRRRRKPKPLSAKEKRILGIYDIPREHQKYEMYEPLHRMWIGYMWEILGLKGNHPAYVTAQGAGPKLASADYHGAELEVVRSRCVGRVGCKGIVVKDTKFTFEMITKKNILRTVPKKHSIFRFEIPKPTSEPPPEDTTMTGRGGREDLEGSAARFLIFELHGSQFEVRATDRATKKFKQRRMDDL
ncbi:hypothetical protein MMC19_002314 [Ptychographa xylographoides]|nr:hypothetical protein [Ptychographa xylographoides]